MRNLACATLILLASACATAPVPRPQLGAQASVSTPTSGAHLRLVHAPVVDPALEQSRIGKADLEQARALLSLARDELEPRHWDALDRKLTEAEQAWERFSRAARTSGQVAEVVRGAEGAAQAGRARQTVGALSRVGPLLVALCLLWPSSTAGPEDDSPPLWAEAQRELGVRLRDVAEASRQVMVELEPQPAPSKGAPPADTQAGRPQCEPVPVPHRGGDATHDRCADVFPPNRFPGHDVLVNGKRFDALQVGVRVLWEIKTDNFDTYTADLQRIVIDKQVLELQRERELARVCGFDFRVGVLSVTHKAVLEARDRTLHILIMNGC